MKGYEEEYLVSDLGRLFSKKSGKYLTPVKTADGYEKVFLSTGGKVKCFRVHRIVAEAFLSGEGSLVHHVDENRSNNAAVNLKYVTAKGHCDFHPTMGVPPPFKGRPGIRVSINTEFKPGNKFRFPAGENNPLAKFKEGEVWLIKKLQRGGVSRSMIAKMFMVKPKKIDCILYGYAWKSVTV